MYSYLEGVGQEVRRKFTETVAGNNTCVAKVQERHLQDNNIILVHEETLLKRTRELLGKIY